MNQSNPQMFWYLTIFLPSVKMKECPISKGKEYLSGDITPLKTNMTFSKSPFFTVTYIFIHGGFFQLVISSFSGGTI